MIGRNVVGCVVLAAAAVARGSVALAAFGIDSLIEILACMIVVWQLRAPTPPSGHAQRSQIIAIAFTGPAIYIAIQPSIVLASTDAPATRRRDALRPDRPPRLLTRT
jgi:hypothetical protein